MRKTALLFALFLVLCCSPVFAANDVGTVISVKPGAFALRDGKEVPLALKDRVISTDVLVTNASGRLQVFLDDDSTISLASDTRLELLEVIAEGKPEFKAHIATGLARFITGKIVEQNPDGFTVSTPQGTVGIRGTIFAIRAIDGTVTVFVTHTTKGSVDFAGQTIPSGSKMTIHPDGSVTIQPMTPEENDRIEKQTAAGTSSGEVVAAGKTTSSEGKEETIFTVAETGTDDTNLKNLTPKDMFPAPPELLLQADHVAVMRGEFPSPGEFGFTANLTSGLVDSGWIKTISMSYVGGSGTIDPYTVSVSNYSIDPYAAPQANDNFAAASSSYNGSVTILGNTLTTTGTLSITTGAGSYSISSNSATATGTITP